MEKERAMIFVDHANVFKNLENLEIRINWDQFTKILAGDSYLVGRLMYMGLPAKLRYKKERFLKYLRTIDYVIQQRPLKILSSGKKKQKGVDIFMFQEIVELANEDAYDKAIIVSGDADFIDAIKKLKELGKPYEVWSFKKSLSRSLVEEAGIHNIYHIDTVLEVIELSTY